MSFKFKTALPGFKPFGYDELATRIIAHSYPNGIPDVPPGYEVIDFGPCKANVPFLDIFGQAITLETDGYPEYFRLHLRAKEKPSASPVRSVTLGTCSSDGKKYVRQVYTQAFGPISIPNGYEYVGFDKVSAENNLGLGSCDPTVVVDYTTWEEYHDDYRILVRRVAPQPAKEDVSGLLDEVKQLRAALNTFLIKYGGAA